MHSFNADIPPVMYPGTISFIFFIHFSGEESVASVRSCKLVPVWPEEGPFSSGIKWTYQSWCVSLNGGQGSSDLNLHLGYFQNTKTKQAKY